VRGRDEFVEQVREWAAAQPDVQAAMPVGSAARSATPADEWSDIDIGLIVDDPAPYLRDAAWLAPFGTPLLTFVEPTAIGISHERRVLFDDGTEADFAFFPAAAIEQLRADAGADATLRRGYRVLVDRIGIERLLDAPSPQAPPADAAMLAHLANDVWYHALWAAKKLRRGELWVARSCVDCYLHARLLEIAALHAQALSPAVDTWHGGRFLERWASDDVVAELWDSLARGREDIAAAIRRSVTLFDRLIDETAARLGVRLELPREQARARLEGLLAVADVGRRSGD
jgi:aminoglycoside 6-adenylyltransferase